MGSVGRIVLATIGLGLWGVPGAGNAQSYEIDEVPDSTWFTNQIGAR
jgi:hypothetical protein